MTSPAIRLRFKRFLQLTGLLGVALGTVSISVRAPAGIQGSGFRSLAVVGTVTGLTDGVTVGGVTYPTAGAVFKFDGEPGSAAQLRNGYIVSLAGTASADGHQASLSTVIFNGTVQGPVSGLDAQSGIFFVLGQTVRVDSNTIFGAGIQPASLAGLQNGTVVEVSAFASSTGELVASRIEAKGNSALAQVVGTVQAFNGAQQTFRINSLTVDYHSAAVDGVLAEGTAVAVQGLNGAGEGTFIASRVEALPAVNATPGAIGRIEGLITRFPSSAYFEVEGQPVSVDAQTKLHLHGQLGLDVKVKVTGTFDANGVLVARKLHSSKQ